MDKLAQRAVVVGFDGLRPDLVRPDLTPNLWRFRSLGVVFARHRTVYPSETRVAFTSLVTGAPASAHGNRYLDRSARTARFVDTGDARLLEALDGESGGRLLTSLSLGEVLAAEGRSLAVIATNSRGATRLLNHKARILGHICLSGHFPEVATPDDLARSIIQRLGPPGPEPKPEPATVAQDYITSAFLDHVWPQARPDVTILFYGEPDSSSHFNGILSEKTRSAIAACDRAFGRVLNWWEAEGRDQGVQLLTVSDHGHITQHTRVAVADALRSAGFAIGAALDSDAGAVVIPGHVGAVYLADPSPTRIAKAADALMDQPWCGPIFTSARNEVEGVAPGTLASSLVFCDHARAPDLQFAFRTDDRTDAYGLVGGTFFENERAPGTGVHGGLHPKELGAVCMAAGSAFTAGLVSITPSGIVDVAPTLLHLLGIPAPSSMRGRILCEGLAEMPSAPASAKAEIHETGRGAYGQALRRLRVGASVYIDGGWAGSDAGTAAQLNQAWG